MVDQPIPPPPPPAPAAPQAVTGRYPVSLTVEGGAGPRSRAKAFFRIILAIPWMIVGAVYGVVGLVLTLVSWICVVVLGRYPDRLYGWMSGLMRYSARLGAFVLLLTDQWPTFGWGVEPEHPVKLAIAPRAESQSRLKAFFRVILAVPLFVLSYGINFIMEGGAIASWLTIVFRGYQPAWLEAAMTAAYGWNLRINAYMVLITDVYPPVGDDAPKLALST
jgi:uncharacterized protein DUF4389